MTLRQKKALANIAKHGSVKEAMIAAGYSEATAKNPSKNLLEKPEFKVLLEQYLPDSKLLDVHDKLLDSKRDEIRLGAVSLGYKVKGKLQPENVNQINVGEMSVQFREKTDDI